MPIGLQFVHEQHTDFAVLDVRHSMVSVPDITQRTLCDWTTVSVRIAMPDSTVETMVGGRYDVLGRA